MSTTINWLHLTDWHVGKSAQGHLWPNVRTEFERDVGELIQKHGPIDVVFFTGDLVQSGRLKQFHELEQNVKRLWSFFNSTNSTPKLVVIPGNHDLRRPEPSKAAVLALNAWEQQAEIRETFWTNTKSDLRRCIESSFEEFDRWLNTTSAPLLFGSDRFLPGDIAVTFEKENIRIGVVGLNTTFLQLRDGNYEGRLAVSARQLNHVCGGDYAGWVGKHHLTVLMTHQPESWLTREAREEFARDIAPPGRFDIHLSGHLHAAKTTLTSEAGSPFRLCHQGTSLFGLEFFGDQRKEQRTHGYLMGQWIVGDTAISERLWPRIAVTKQGGALGLVADPSSYLDSDEAIHRSLQLKLTTLPSSPAAKNDDIAARSAAQGEQTSLFEELLEPSEVQKKLRRALRFSHPTQLHHLSVRSDQRERLADALKEQRCGWIVTDWGMGNDGFIASVLRSESFQEDERYRFEDRIFQLRCDTLERVSDIEQAFRPQFGLSLAEFLQCVTSAGPSCLLLDGIQSALTEEVEREHLIRLLDLHLDYAPTLSLIVVSRTSTPWRISPVEIQPLDLPDFRAYVQNHLMLRRNFRLGMFWNDSSTRAEDYQFT